MPDDADRIWAAQCPCGAVIAAFRDGDYNDRDRRAKLGGWVIEGLDPIVVDGEVTLKNCGCQRKRLDNA